MGDLLFEAKGVGKTYGANTVLRDIDMQVYSGEVIGLIGENGAGKSTLMKLISGVEKPSMGEMFRMGKPYSASSILDANHQGIGMVFQEPEHQFVASSVRDEAAVGPKSMGKSEEESYAIADNMLERMNLARFAQANPFTLSGGEKRRLSVASMLAAAPKVLVMDEPTFGQDFTTWTEMVKLIAGARDAGCSVIMVTHDEPLIETLGARRVLVSEGE